MKNLTLILLIILSGMTSCKKEKFEGVLINDPDFAQELRSSPEIISIDNNTLILTTYLWRDFMPMAEKDGDNMICVNHLIEVDSIPILSTMELKKQYVINGDEIWSAEYTEITNTIDYLLKGVVREGPKWGPNINVDVVCEFTNNGMTYRILAKSQPIGRTD